MFSETPVKFTVPLADKTVPEKTDAVLECEVNKVDAEVTWYKDGKPLKSTEKCRITKEGNVHRLTLKDVTPRQVAKYTAKTGPESTSAKLTLEGREFVLVCPID